MKGRTKLRHLAASVLRRRRPLRAEEAYALWAESYPPSPHNPLMQAEQAVMAPIIQSTSPQRALDAGTGSGRYLPLLASTGARVVIGVDLSIPMLVSRAARATQREPRVCGDAQRLPFADASFDLISSSLMVGDVANLDGWVSEAVRVLAPGGHLVYSDFHPSWATKGWRRTFHTADGRSFEVAYFSHTLDQHVTALEGRGFDIRTIREPRLATPTGAGGSDGPVASGGMPVAIVFHAVKRG